MNEIDEVRSLLEYMVRGFVDQPEEVKVIAELQEDGMLFRLAAAAPDIEKLNGKHNHTARSMRIILSAIGAKLNQKLSLAISK